MKILEYDLNSLPGNPVILLIGRRRSGKTVTTMNLMRHYSKKVRYAIAMVGSNSTVAEFSEIMPATFIYDTVDFDVLQRLIDKQNAAARTGTPDEVLVVIDDLAYGNFFKSPQIKLLVCNGRHLKITLIITAQYLRVCPPIFRANTDVVFAAQEKSTAYRKALYENFSICFSNYFDFNRTYRELTTDYSMMVLVTCSGNPSDRVEDNVFWIKSPFPLPKFKINESGGWWKLHARTRDPLGASSMKAGQIRKITLLERKNALGAPQVRAAAPKKQEEEKKEIIMTLSNRDSIPLRMRPSRFL